MESEEISETFVDISTVTRLIARGYFNMQKKPVLYFSGFHLFLINNPAKEYFLNVLTLFVLNYAVDINTK
jgi:hypothetical protein